LSVDSAVAEQVRIPPAYHARTGFQPRESERKGPLRQGNLKKL
jgi:hypothetical protein